MDHDNCPMTQKRFGTLLVERALYQISIIIIIIIIIIIYYYYYYYY